MAVPFDDEVPRDSFVEPVNLVAGESSEIGVGVETYRPGGLAAIETSHVRH